MEQTNSRWFFIFVLMSLISIIFFPQKTHADSNWLKYFRKDSLVNTYKTSYAVMDDVLWVGTFGDGLTMYDGAKEKSLTNRNTRTSPSADDGLVSDYITCISVDEKRGRVWLGTNAGLSSCDLEGKEWERYTEKEGLPNAVIRDLAIDAVGNLWVGTPSGIALYDGEKWQIMDERNGLPQGSVHSIKVKGDSVWVGTVGGTVSRYKDGEWKTFVSFN
jgi:ligand-binding sensor domain-containing protein